MLKQDVNQFASMLVFQSLLSSKQETSIMKLCLRHVLSQKFERQHRSENYLTNITPTSCRTMMLINQI